MMEREKENHVTEFRRYLVPTTDLALTVTVIVVDCESKVVGAEVESPAGWAGGGSGEVGGGAGGSCSLKFITYYGPRPAAGFIIIITTQ